MNEQQPQIERLREIYHNVPVLDDAQKEKLKAIFEEAVVKAKADELPKSRWEERQEEKKRSGKRAEKKDPRDPGDYAEQMQRFLDQYGDDGAKSTVAEFTRAHQAIRVNPETADVLYGDKDAKVMDSDLFFAIRQVYKPLQMPQRR